MTRGRLAALVASRFVLNAIFRVAYPLIPFVAARYTVPEAAATWIVTVQVLFGLMSPVAGWLGDRIGYRRTMLLGLCGSLIGTVLVALAPNFVLLVVAFGVCGLGAAIYLPGMQAYVSALTHYGERGRAIGLVELSWSLAGIAAVPLLAWLVDVQNSTTIAFAALAVCVAGVTAITLTLPAEVVQVGSGNDDRPSLRTIMTPSVLGLLVFVALALGGNELLFIVQPTWATERFGASLSALGTAAFVFGFGEFGGALGSAVLTDRLGKRRAALWGFGVTAIVFLLLPLLSVNWISYLLCYLLFGLCVEFAIVATLTLASTVSVVGRGTIMALTVTVMQLGRAVASQIGVPLFQAGSVGVNAIVAAVLVALGVLIASRLVHEGEQSVAA
jgi:predicted MFS family arabinose efflux permease